MLKITFPIYTNDHVQLTISNCTRNMVRMYGDALNIEDLYDVHCELCVPHPTFVDVWYEEGTVPVLEMTTLDNKSWEDINQPTWLDEETNVTYYRFNEVML